MKLEITVFSTADHLSDYVYDRLREHMDKQWPPKSDKSIIFDGVNAETVVIEVDFMTWLRVKLLGQKAIGEDYEIFP